MPENRKTRPPLTPTAGGSPPCHPRIRRRACHVRRLSPHEPVSSELEGSRLGRDIARCSLLRRRNKKFRAGKSPRDCRSVAICRFFLPANHPGFPDEKVRTRTEYRTRLPECAESPANPCSMPRACPDHHCRALALLLAG